MINRSKMSNYAQSILFIKPDYTKSLSYITKVDFSRTIWGLKNVYSNFAGDILSLNHKSRYSNYYYNILGDTYYLGLNIESDNPYTLDDLSFIPDTITHKRGNRYG